MDLKYFTVGDRKRRLVSGVSHYCNTSSLSFQSLIFSVGLIPTRVADPDPDGSVNVFMGWLRFRQGSGSGSAWIRINLSCWIRIRIQIADPDSGGQKCPTKIEKSTEFSCFEVLDVLF